MEGFVPCDEEIKKAVDAVVPARALKLVFDKSHPRLIQVWSEEHCAFQAAIADACWCFKKKMANKYDNELEVWRCLLVLRRQALLARTAPHAEVDDATVGMVCTFLVQMALRHRRHRTKVGEVCRYLKLRSAQWRQAIEMHSGLAEIDSSGPVRLPTRTLELPRDVAALFGSGDGDDPPIQEIAQEVAERCGVMQEAKYASTICFRGDPECVNQAVDLFERVVRAEVVCLEVGAEVEVDVQQIQVWGQDLQLRLGDVHVGEGQVRYSVCGPILRKAALYCRIHDAVLASEARVTADAAAAQATAEVACLQPVLVDAQADAARARENAEATTASLDRLIKSGREWARTNWPAGLGLCQIENIEENPALRLGCPAVLKFQLGRLATQSEGLIQFGGHGTTPDAVAPICHDNFDPGRRQGQMYGPGEYFCTGSNMQYSIGWAQQRSSNQLIVAALLDVGRLSRNADGTFVLNNPSSQCMDCLPILVVTFRSQQVLRAPAPFHCTCPAKTASAAAEASKVVDDIKDALAQAEIVSVKANEKALLARVVEEHFAILVDPPSDLNYIVRKANQQDGRPPWAVEDAEWPSGAVWQFVLRGTFETELEAQREMQRFWQAKTGLDSYASTVPRRGQWCAVKPGAQEAAKERLKHWVWQFYVQPGGQDQYREGWHNYKVGVKDGQMQDSSEVLEVFYKQWVVNACPVVWSKRTVQSAQYHYEVNFNEWSQMNTATQTMRKIRRQEACNRCRCTACPQITAASSEASTDAASVASEESDSLQNL